ncbi:tripartite tricarboxylate transporter substrate binding protein [Pseudacidovorax sp. RU35E]|uniref:tripartite tricarboxylate transporter substrate binding protein n=1 Tax=Pseudacidovorax sp. RU35E TaxID=1907403 RepID=UPI000956EF9B|nr:tripartite tricarboxylate transporter substrate binding protein [Pseudacidovorax sp. RU35E]SIR76394.1 Tripartite-type tricarboxylate transporter, receptor component TctC [Pseudacidovorax sp. RU35E]
MKELMVCVLGAVLAIAAHGQVLGGPVLRLVVPYGPGGGTDHIARLIAPRLGVELGRSVIVDNRPGASTRVGTNEVAKAVPDGQTLLIVDTAFTTNPSLYRKIPYDSAKDFAPVALLATAPVVLIVHPSMPVQNLRELIALGKKQSLQTASAGLGGATHLGAELFASLAGIKLEQVLYKGAGPALTDLIGGQIPMAVTGISSVKPFVEAGRLRGIAVSGAQRSSSLPNVPTFAEAGLPGVEANTYWGALAPSGTSQSTIERIGRAMAVAVNAPELAARLSELGFTPIGGSADEYRANIRHETSRWKEVIRTSGVSMED